MESKPVTIIGAGVSGLIAALELEKHGRSAVIFEASDRVGGRVKTDVIDGYRLDHGFQVLLTAYPEARQYLNYEALDLRSFSPGAIIYDGDRSFPLNDPIRQPSKLFAMMFSPVGTIKDKVKMWTLSMRLKKKSLEKIFSEKEITTLQYLRDYGFSEKVIHHFFKPFFSGIFLEDQLVTSSRMFEFVFKMFGEGNAAIPAKGMQEIPNQLEAGLKNTTIHFNKKVDRLQGRKITFTDGESVEVESTIIACDPYNILQGLSSQTQDYHSVINLYFTTSGSVIKQPLIGLDCVKDHLINNFNFMTDVSQAYAPSDKHLLSVSVVKKVALEEQELVAIIKKEFSQITGQDPADMEFIKCFKIIKALPLLNDIRMSIEPAATQIQDNVFMAGDYLLNGSLNAAMTSGRIAARAVLFNNVN